MSWSAVKDIKAADQTFRGKVLTIQVVTAAGGTEKRTVPLSKLADGDDAVLQVVGRYYNRYLNAVAFQRPASAGELTARSLLFLPAWRILRRASRRC